MARPSNAVQKTRADLAEKAAKQAAKAREALLLAQAAGAPPASEAEEDTDLHLEDPNPQPADEPRPRGAALDLAMLRGTGTVYLTKVEGTEETRIPAIKREILSEDAHEIPQSWGDGKYRMIVKDEHGHYRGSLVTTFSGFGEGSKYAELRLMKMGAPLQAAAQPDPEAGRLAGLVEAQQRKLDELNERLLKTQKDGQDRVLDMMQENNRTMLELVKAQNHQSPATVAVDPAQSLLATMELLDRIRGTGKQDAGPAINEGNPLGSITNIVSYIKENKEIFGPILGIETSVASDWTDKVAKILVAGGPIVDKILARIPVRQAPPLHRQPAPPSAPALPGPAAVGPAGGQPAEIPSTTQAMTEAAPPAPGTQEATVQIPGVDTAVTDEMLQEAAAMKEVKESIYYQQYVPKVIQRAIEKYDPAEMADELLSAVTGIFVPDVALDILLDITEDPDMIVKLAAYEPVATEHAAWLLDVAKAVNVQYKAENPDYVPERERAARENPPTSDVPPQGASAGHEPEAAGVGSSGGNGHGEAENVPAVPAAGAEVTP